MRTRSTRGRYSSNFCPITRKIAFTSSPLFLCVAPLINQALLHLCLPTPLTHKSLEAAAAESVDDEDDDDVEEEGPDTAEALPGEAVAVRE